MKKTLVSMLFLSLFLILGCQKDNEVTYTTLPEVAEYNIENTHEDTNVEQIQIDEFTINFNGKLISLHDWDNEVDLEQVFGKPLSQDIVELADSFTGSLLKKIKYDGLEMELFSPLGNGKNFWIMTMNISKTGYTTSKGIELGSTEQEVKDAYPDIKIAKDGRTDPNNFAYEINDDQYNYLQFEIKDGVVRQIKIFHLIP
ncbi:MAG: hypothetical protein ACQEXQ_01200 [Bacillota bacterium]